MNQRPLIGITAYDMRRPEASHGNLYAVGQCYVHALEGSHAVPLIVPPGLSQASLRHVFDRLDGLVLSGGGDIDPAVYGEAPHPTLSGMSVERDRAELSLARWAVEGHKPILSICRGIQVLNVALGGSLVQDIPSHAPGALEHSFDSAQFLHDHMAHPVQVEPGSRLAGVLGLETVQVNSRHHQAIKRPAAQLAVVARSPDGVVEAVEIAGHPFAIGVQWHPECLYARQPETQRLFAALVEAASGAG
jgi:putative glutamine amidotransferase